jgi:hypothetical protein
LGERRRIEGGDIYGPDSETQIELGVDKDDLRAVQGSHLSLLGRSLNHAIGARRAFMVGVALGRVSVQRLGC